MSVCALRIPELIDKRFLIKPHPNTQATVLEEESCMMLNHQCVFVTILWDFYLHGFLTSTTSEKGDNDIQKIENPTETVMVEAKKKSLNIKK